jgi:[acyl-carrier-protein] S-malonyltransferase
MNENGKTAFAFPGMGIRLTGFELAVFCRHEADMRPFFDEASTIAAIDLAGVLKNNTVGELDDRNSQIFTYTFSAALSVVCRKNGTIPAYVAGYSFGYYAALFTAQTLPFKEILTLACRAFDIMAERCNGKNYGMATIIGLTLAEIDELNNGKVAVVNINSDACVIVAGSVPELVALCAQAVRLGAIKAELLPVRIPYHHPGVLAAASDTLRAYLTTFAWQQPVIPVISSVDNSLLTSTADIIDYTARHLCTPLNWLTTMGRLHSLGVTRIVECGPGISLSRHGQFMPFDISYVNVKNLPKRLDL